MLFHIAELCYALACIRITAHDFHLFIFTPMTVNPFHFLTMMFSRNKTYAKLQSKKVSAPPKFGPHRIRTCKAWRVRIGVACGGAAAGGLGAQRRLVRRGAGGGGAAGPEVPSPWCGAARRGPRRPRRSKFASDNITDTIPCIQLPFFALTCERINI